MPLGRKRSEPAGGDASRSSTNTPTNPAGRSTPSRRSSRSSSSSTTPSRGTPRVGASNLRLGASIRRSNTPRGGK